jgi:hypothetical protein
MIADIELPECCLITLRNGSDQYWIAFAAGLHQ